MEAESEEERKARREEQRRIEAEQEQALRIRLDQRTAGGAGGEGGAGGMGGAEAVATHALAKDAGRKHFDSADWVQQMGPLGSSSSTDEEAQLQAVRAKAEQAGLSPSSDKEDEGKAGSGPEGAGYQASVDRVMGRNRGRRDSADAVMRTRPGSGGAEGGKDGDSGGGDGGSGADEEEVRTRQPQFFGQYLDSVSPEKPDPGRESAAGEGKGHYTVANRAIASSVSRRDSADHELARQTGPVQKKKHGLMAQAAMANAASSRSDLRGNQPQQTHLHHHHHVTPSDEGHAGYHEAAVHAVERPDAMRRFDSADFFMDQTSGAAKVVDRDEPERQSPPRDGQHCEPLPQGERKSPSPQRSASHNPLANTQKASTRVKHTSPLRGGRTPGHLRPQNGNAAAHGASGREAAGAQDRAMAARRTATGDGDAKAT